MKRIKIFISSVFDEFKEERSMLCEYLRTDVLFGKLFETFIFENNPAESKAPQDVYLKEVEQCDVYIGIIGAKYGYEDSDGVSPTEREYDKASELCKHRLIFINSTTEHNRHPKEKNFIKKIEQSVVRKTFIDAEGLRAAVYAALIRYLEEKEIIRWRPFDASFDNDATLDDLDEEKIRNFIKMARSKRNFILPVETPIDEFLKHLDLLSNDGRIANAAILLFGKKPQKFFPSSEIKCIQLFGNTMERPAPSYQIYKGDVFELVNQATAFVMSRVNNWVGVRGDKDSAMVQTRQELPMEAVQEAIVNAICHRDYTSNGSVQVMLFKNRLEIWNPGQLPFGMTIESLYKPHRSLPVNPLLAEPMYWNGYIEKIGSGTEDMVKRCINHGLKSPEFFQDNDFKVIFWRPTSVMENTTAEQSVEIVPDRVKRLLRIMDGELSISEILKLLQLKHRGNLMKEYLSPALGKYIEMTLPDTPKSPAQKYRLTSAGLNVKRTLIMA